MFFKNSLDCADTLKEKGNISFHEAEGEVHVWSVWRNNLYETAPLPFLSHPWRGNQPLRTASVARDRLVRSATNIFQFGDNQ